MTNINNLWDWYSNPAVKFEIIKFLFNREFACLVPKWCPKEMAIKSTRNFRCHSVQHLDYILNGILKARERETIYNLYYSSAKFESGIPMQNPNLAKRDNIEWNINFWKKIISYDWLIDIDSGSHDDIEFAHESTKELMDFLDKHFIPYEVRFSGMGFHVVVRGKYFNNLNVMMLENKFNPHVETNVYSLYNTLSRKLYEEISEMIDWNINDSRRIIKIPYSLSVYENQKYVCLPFLSKKEFDEFDLEKMESKYWGDKIRGRGTFIFNWEKQKPLNISEFL